MRTQGRLGLRVNWEKSKLSPMQRIPFLSTELDLVNQTARLKQERAQSVLNCLNTFKNRTAATVKQFQSIEMLRRQDANLQDLSPALCLPRSPAEGNAISKQRMAHWIVVSITLAYQAQGVPCPFRLRAHSTRSVGSSWALTRGASLTDICRAVGWATPNTFARFYSLCVEPVSSCVLTSNR